MKLPLSAVLESLANLIASEVTNSDMSHALPDLKPLPEEEPSNTNEEPSNTNEEPTDKNLEDQLDHSLDELLDGVIDHTLKRLLEPPNNNKPPVVKEVDEMPEEVKKLFAAEYIRLDEDETSSDETSSSEGIEDASPLTDYTDDEDMLEGRYDSGIQETLSDIPSEDEEQEVMENEEVQGGAEETMENEAQGAEASEGNYMSYIVHSYILL